VEPPLSFSSSSPAAARYLPGRVAAAVWRDTLDGEWLDAPGLDRSPERSYRDEISAPLLHLRPLAGGSRLPLLLA